MKNYLISYDLHKQGQNYDILITCIKSFPAWEKIHQSVWYVKSSSNAEEIRGKLSRHIDINDSLFVAEMNNAAWVNLGERGNYIHQQWHR